VFHAPHAPHRPDQRGALFPHSVQRWTVRSFGTPPTVKRGCNNYVDRPPALAPAKNC
jgi:hypothetical protein